jgi:hypothetical protein
MWMKYLRLIVHLLHFQLFSFFCFQRFIWRGIFIEAGSVNSECQWQTPILGSKCVWLRNSCLYLYFGWYNLMYVSALSFPVQSYASRAGIIVWTWWAELPVTVHGTIHRQGISPVIDGLDSTCTVKRNWNALHMTSVWIVGGGVNPGSHRRYCAGLLEYHVHCDTHCGTATAWWSQSFKPQVVFGQFKCCIWLAMNTCDVATSLIISQWQVAWL